MGTPLETSIATLVGGLAHATLRRHPIREAPPLPRDVCPHCKAEVIAHRFWAGETLVSSYTCPTHGAVSPMRSAVVNSHVLAEAMHTCPYCTHPVDRHAVMCARPRGERATDWSAS